MCKIKIILTNPNKLRQTFPFEYKLGLNLTLSPSLYDVMEQTRGGFIG